MSPAQLPNPPTLQRVQRISRRSWYSFKRLLHRVEVGKVLFPGSGLQTRGGASDMSSRLVLFVVAFNNSRLIEKQIVTLRRNLSDPLVLYIADNSELQEARAEIARICAREKVNYLSIPESVSKSAADPSSSHGAALNWILSSTVLRLKPTYFGFLDHDNFAFERVSILDRLAGKGVYGHFQAREGRWYLWPGFCFFEYQFLQGKWLDFRPCAGLDTGGKNWELLFQNMDKRQVDFSIDGWCHIHNGSNYRSESDHAEKIADFFSEFGI
jgi:hypothetical protein